MVIGIGGISNAGKSSLASLIRKRLEDDYSRIKILCQDDFIVPQEEIPVVNGITDWECPSSINHTMYFQAVERERQNNDIVISEGLFAYHDDRLCNIYDKKLFLHIDKDVFRQRKRNDLRWGHVPAWYIEHIWESYLKFGKARTTEGVKRIEASGNFDMDDVIAFLKS